jgi:predicted cytidylate kinase
LLVTISGLPGSGTSTVARLVADALGLERLDGGTVFRSMAADRGMSVGEFSAVAERDDTIDVELDRRLAVRATQGDVVLESRLAGWIATNGHLPALRVWIDCDADERARRVASREHLDVEVAAEANRVREASERARYLAYYDLDIDDRSPYDLVLDSGRAAPEDLVRAIVEAARSRP